jgi:hypothetical protein
MILVAIDANGPPEEPEHDPPPPLARLPRARDARGPAIERPRPSILLTMQALSRACNSSRSQQATRARQLLYMGCNSSRPIARGRAARNSESFGQTRAHTWGVTACENNGGIREFLLIFVRNHLPRIDLARVAGIPDFSRIRSLAPSNPRNGMFHRLAKLSGG